MKANPYVPPILYDLWRMVSRLFPRPKRTAKALPPSVKTVKTKRTAVNRPRVVKAEFSLWRIGMILGSLVLAALGQMQWIDVSSNKTLWYGMVFYGLAVALFLFALKPWEKEELARVPLDPKWEWGFFAAIMLVAAFFRIFRLDSFPNGIFIDQGFEGWGALTIGHEGWKVEVIAVPCFLAGLAALYGSVRSFLQLFPPVPGKAKAPPSRAPLLRGFLWLLMSCALLAIATWIYQNNKLFPFFLGEPLNFPAYLLYVMAPWFWIFKNDQFNLYLFFVLVGLATLPFVYWTFRQMMGPRVALLSLYFLAIMRWNFNLCRNGFPTVQVPFYMFVTLSFLLYGFRSRKWWPFLVAAVFFPAGLYTYQAYKIFPLLLLIYGIYEFLADRKAVFENRRRLLAFSAIFLFLISPIVFDIVKTGSIGHREDSNSIVSEIRAKHSLQPLQQMIWKTLFMCNRMGDDNERHNDPNHRMLDDFSGTLFVLGVFYALSRAWRRKYFYALAGLAVMSLPCLLSVVPAHANRMMGVTAFVCFLSATPLAAVWGRIKAKWGSAGEALFLVILYAPLMLAALQNYDVYFHKQAGNNSYWTTAYWGGYSYDASAIGKAIAANGDAYDYFLFPRHYEHSTIKYLAYFQRDRVKQMDIPASFAPLQTDPSRGLFFAFLEDQKGFLRYVQDLYPGCEVDGVKDLNGKTVVYLAKVPPAQAAKAKGLILRYPDGREQQVPGFPGGLPPGPYQAGLRGCLYVANADDYRFGSQANCGLVWSVGGHRITPATVLHLAKGFYAVDIHLSVTTGAPQIKLSLIPPTNHPIELDNTHFTNLPVNHGLHATYFQDANSNGKPALEEWDPLVNFIAGNDFPYLNWQETAYWEGTLLAPRTGRYQFLAKTDEFAEIKIDQKAVAPWGRGNPAGTVDLTAGPHKFGARFQKDLGPILTLFWLTPGGKGFEVIPASAFGEAH